MKTKIDQLKKELEALRNISNEGVISFEKRIAALEKQEDESAELKFGDIYCNYRGNSERWDNDHSDIYHLAHGLAFRTKEAYEKWSRWTQIDVRVKKAIREGEKMYEAHKRSNSVWFLWADFDMGERIKGVMGTHLIEANSKEALEHVIKVIGKADLKWYFENRI